MTESAPKFYNWDKIYEVVESIIKINKSTNSQVFLYDCGTIILEATTSNPF